MEPDADAVPTPPAGVATSGTAADPLPKAGGTADMPTIVEIVQIAQSSSAAAAAAPMDEDVLE
eukprot:712968-Prorocentrum_lima.AAC.1